MADLFDPKDPALEQPAAQPVTRHRRSDRHRAPQVEKTPQVSGDTRVVPMIRAGSAERPAYQAEPKAEAPAPQPEQPVSQPEEQPVSQPEPPIQPPEQPASDADKLPVDGDTRVMPAIGADRPIRREITFDPLAQGNATPGGVPPIKPPVNDAVPVLGADDVPPPPPPQVYAARDPLLDDQQLYPLEDDYYDDDDAPRSRPWLIALIGLAVVLALFAAGMLLLPKVVDRPRNGQGFAAALYDLRDKIGSVFGLEGEPAEISLFQTANNTVTVGSQMQFTITTTKAVQNVGLMTASGVRLPATSQCKDAEDGTTWVATIRFDEPYIDDVYAAIQDKNGWRRTNSYLALYVTEPTAAPTATPTPEAEETPAPTPTEVPIFVTQAPAMLLDATDAPSEEPAALPTDAPTLAPTAEPTAAPTDAPTPTPEPTEEPTAAPLVINQAPAALPGSAEPTAIPTATPVFTATPAPTEVPIFVTQAPTAVMTAVPTATPTPVPTATPTPVPTATPTPTPVPTATPMPLLEAEAAPNADPKQLNLTQTVYSAGKKLAADALARQTAVAMSAPDSYSSYPGVSVFRGSSFRQNAAYGTAEITSQELSIEWQYPLGSLRTADYGTLYGVGWTSQPAIIKLATEQRTLWMNIYESKRQVTALKEVIFGALDGNIYFLDLNDGQPTRDPISVGFPLKSSVAVHPQGNPYLAVGQAISKLSSNKTGDIGLRVFSLLDGSEIYLLNGRKSKTQEQYWTNGAFDGSPLFDRSSDTLIVAGENGLIYTVDMNTTFQYLNDDGTVTQTPTLSINPVSTTLMVKAKAEENKDTSSETSVAVYDHYVYSADAYGILQCVDTTTMRAVWAVDVGDNTDAAIALDFDENGDLGLYTGNTCFTRLNKSKAPVTLRRLDALTGAPVWTYEIKCSYDKDQESGLRASPLIGQNELSDLVIFTVNMTGGTGSSTILALDKITGSLVWERKLEANAVSSPVAVYNSAGKGWIIQADRQGRLYLLDGRSGQICHTLALGGDIQASPAVYNDMLVIGTCSKDNAYMYGIRIQ